IPESNVNQILNDCDEIQDIAPSAFQYRPASDFPDMRAALNAEMGTYAGYDIEKNGVTVTEGKQVTKDGWMLVCSRFRIAALDKRQWTHPEKLHW
ncbi:MAG: hypothetical protein WA777_17605, partial [Rhodanobacter sp.]